MSPIAISLVFLMTIKAFLLVSITLKGNQMAALDLLISMVKFTKEKPGTVSSTVGGD